MKYEIDENTIKQIQEDLLELEKLLDERVSDLHEIKGMMQARHAYIFYRNSLFKARILLRDNLKKVPEKFLKP